MAGAELMPENSLLLQLFKQGCFVGTCQERRGPWGLMDHGLGAHTCTHALALTLACLCWYLTARAACPLQAGCGGHRFQWFPLAARSLPLLLQCAHTGTSAGKGELDLGSCGKGRVFKEQEGQNGH